MSDSDYTKIYGGNFIMVGRVKSELEAAGIIPIIKDEGESQRLAGYGSVNQGFQEVFVNNEELNKALEITNRVIAEMKG
ncbi:putative signal transducing protein [Winogradskyella litorisediminis]|uniref:Signal transducing protein n=1 Tax=Winogradskyella litorisediminis TaxID=1156618 RepID=A0ABW3NCZ9_9FLAO